MSSRRPLYYYIYWSWTCSSLFYLLISILLQFSWKKDLERSLWSLLFLWCWLKILYLVYKIISFKHLPCSQIFSFFLYKISISPKPSYLVLVESEEEFWKFLLFFQNYMIFFCFPKFSYFPLAWIRLIHINEKYYYFY